MLDSTTENMTREELAERAGELDNELRDVKQAEEILRRQNEYLTALHETSLELIDHLDKEELLEAVLQRAAMLTGTEHGYIYLLEPDGIEMQMRVGMGFFKSHLGLRVRKGEGMGGQVWKDGQPLLVVDYRSWEGRLGDKSLDDLHSVVGIPLKDRSGIHGVIGLATVKSGRRFKEEDIAILGLFVAIVLPQVLSGNWSRAVIMVIIVIGLIFYRRHLKNWD